MAKGKYIGTCQACGRNHVVKAGGVMAKHGYTVDWGYFNGVCGGSDERPLELDREYADRCVVLYKAEAERLMAITAADVDEIRIDIKKRFVVVDYKICRTAEEFEAAGMGAYRGYGPVEGFKKAKERKAGELNHRGKNLDIHANQMVRTIANVHGTELVDREAEEAKVDRVREEFENYPLAYERGEELKAKGYKVRCIRVKYARGAWAVTATKAV